MARKIDLFILMFFGSVLLLGGSLLAAREIAPFVYAYDTPVGTFGRLQQSPPPVPPSIFGTGISMDICAQALGGLGLHLVPAQRARSIVANCAASAEAAVAAMPTYSYGHYVLALAAWRSQDAQAVAVALSRSHHTGAYAQWIAELRVALTEALYDDLGAYARNEHLGDLNLLARSPAGLPILVALYRDQPDARERITRVIETLAPEAQSRFVAQVRSSMREQGSGL